MRLGVCSGSLLLVLALFQQGVLPAPALTSRVTSGQQFDHFPRPLSARYLWSVQCIWLAFPPSYLPGRGLNADLGVERHLHKCCLGPGGRPVLLLSPEHLNLNDWHCCLRDGVFPAEKLH